MIDCFSQVVRNKGILSLWNGLAANSIKVEFHLCVIRHLPSDMDGAPVYCLSLRSHSSRSQGTCSGPWVMPWWRRVVTPPSLTRMGVISQWGAGEGRAGGGAGKAMFSAWLRASRARWIKSVCGTWSMRRSHVSLQMSGWSHIDFANAAVSCEQMNENKLA